MSVTQYMSKADMWRITGQRIEAAAVLSPTPISEALHCFASLVLFISNILESKEISNENKSYIEHLASRAESIFAIIEQHLTSRKDETKFGAFAQRLYGIVTNVQNCVQQIRRRGSISQVLHAKQDRASCRKHAQQLNELHLDFITYLIHERDSRGPHQLIKHPQLKNFWKYRMRDVHEVRWEHFWRQFLDEYPSLKIDYFGDANTKGKLETLSKEGHLEYVSPWGINNICNSVGNTDLGTDEAPILSHVEDFSGQEQQSILYACSTSILSHVEDLSGQDSQQSILYACSRHDYTDKESCIPYIGNESEEVNKWSMKGIYGWDIFS